MLLQAANFTGHHLIRRIPFCSVVDLKKLLASSNYPLQPYFKKNFFLSFIELY